VAIAATTGLLVAGSTAGFVTGGFTAATFTRSTGADFGSAVRGAEVFAAASTGTLEMPVFCGRSRGAAGTASRDSVAAGGGATIAASTDCDGGRAAISTAAATIQITPIAMARELIVHGKATGCVAEPGCFDR
jgi:hypothetical protein